MNWLTEIISDSNSVAHTILVYSVVIAAGIALGKFKFFNISLGITFVLFTGIAASHFGFGVNMEVLEFVRDFGLILFVFSIGLQVGPAFFESFRKTGLKLNMLALLLVFTGAILTVILHYITGVPMPVMTGIMSGAVTNTPGLGAAQQTINQMFSDNGNPEIPDPGIGYAVAYPFGVIGVILSMLFIRKLFRIDLNTEIKKISEKMHPAEEVPEKITIRVTSEKISGKTVAEISEKAPGNIVISRLLHNGELILPGPGTVVEKNDVMLLVTGKKDLPSIISYLGEPCEIDLASKYGRLVSRRIIVTNTEIAGKRLGELKLRSRYNINITRIERSGFELVANPGLELQMGDRLTVVGDEQSIENVAKETGNSLRRLYEPNLLPIFTGIILGVLIGSIPFRIPGIANPLKLGLAGGPLLVAIFFSKFGKKFSFGIYTTPSAGLMLRETGILLFLASVGLKAGERFIPALSSGEGFIWMGYGAIITFLPVMFTGIIAFKRNKLNYFDVCGLLAGSMTDPPALAYANSIAQSEMPAVAYATVYPLVMFLRIFIAQLLILIFL